jgi:hypothetical protein
MVPYYLRKIYPGIKIGLSFYAKFPNWEHFADAYGKEMNRLRVASLKRKCG